MGTPTRRSRRGQGLTGFAMIMGRVAVVSIGVLAQTGDSVSSLISTIANAITDAGSQGGGQQARPAFSLFGDRFSGFASVVNQPPTSTVAGHAFPC